MQSSLAVPARPIFGQSNGSIAVCRSKNLSGDKENAYLAEGIQDEILTALSKVGGLKVISRNSTQHYKNKPENYVR